MVWNCNKIDHVELENPLMLYLPRFIRVRTLTLETGCDGRHFVPCSCKRREREGVPCHCFFKISDDANVSPENIVDLDQVDPRYWKVYNSHYGDKTEMGQLMHQAQRRSFETEGLGVMITDSTAHKLTGGQSSPYPILGKNTTMEDFLEAKFVMGSQCPCTVLDLERWRAFADLDDCESDNELHPDNTPLSMLDTYIFLFFPTC